VRLLLSWSRVEPRPGAYDEAYLDEVEVFARMLERRGVYSISISTRTPGAPAWRHGPTRSSRARIFPPSAGTARRRREACGDPHKAGDVRDGRIPQVWGLFDVDCVANRVRGWRGALVDDLRRPVVRAAPDAIGEVIWDDATRSFEMRGAGARPGTSFAVFWPSRGSAPRADTKGLRAVRFEGAPGGQHYVVGRARGGAWELRLRDR